MFPVLISPKCCTGCTYLCLVVFSEAERFISEGQEEVKEQKTEESEAAARGGRRDHCSNPDEEESVIITYNDTSAPVFNSRESETCVALSKQGFKIIQREKLFDHIIDMYNI